ncbi:unnamed protein product, partial [marine sediment metagenome]
KMKRRVIIVVCLRLEEGMTERIRNFQACLAALNDQTVERDRYEVWICEEGTHPVANSCADPLWDQYVFRYSDKPFNRSRALNEGARATEARAKDFICLMDADLLVDWQWVKRMYRWAREYPVGMIPYQNVLYLDHYSTEYAIGARANNYMDLTLLTAERNSPNSVGGVIWIHSALYWHIGGHDEGYLGWGCEDMDFFFKLEAACRPKRLQGVSLLHLNHPKVSKHPNY